MTAYYIGQHVISDRAAFGDYLAKTIPFIEKHGGRYMDLAAAKAMPASSKPKPGATPPTAQSARRWSIWNRFPRLPAKWTWCWAPAGPA